MPRDDLDVFEVFGAVSIAWFRRLEDPDEAPTVDEESDCRTPGHEHDQNEEDLARVDFDAQTDTQCS